MHQTPVVTHIGRELFWAVLGALVVLVVGSLPNVWGELSAKGAITREIADARQIVLAIGLASADESDLEIKTLDDLVTKGLLTDDTPIYKRMPDGTKKARWIFYPKNTNPSAPGGSPIIISVETSSGKRIVGNNDTSLELFKGDPPPECAQEHGIQTDADSAGRK
jgi:hypothetical protein